MPLAIIICFIRCLAMAQEATNGTVRLIGHQIFVGITNRAVVVSIHAAAIFFANATVMHD